MPQLSNKQRLGAYKTVLMVYLSLDWLNPESLYSHFRAYFQINYPNLTDLTELNGGFVLADEFPELWDVLEDIDQVRSPANNKIEREEKVRILRQSIKKLDSTYTASKSLKGIAVYLLSFIIGYLFFCLIFLYYTDNYLEILGTKEVARFYTLFIGWWLSLLPVVIFWKKKRN